MTRPKCLQAVRGMQDILPEEADRWRHVEDLLAAQLARYGYRELRLPFLERTAVFSRSLGQETDVVTKEMYSFIDRNGESLSLRPEGTAGMVRAVLEQGLIHNQSQRLWYSGPMFRHERPQRGRLRQFHQWGVEAYGFAGPDIDAEQILLCARLWQCLGVSGLCLVINCLGRAESRTVYREALMEYFTAHQADLDEDSRRRLQSNPLRILDSKNPHLAALIDAAPAMPDYLDAQSESHFACLLAILDESGIDYRVNPHLVRGLDYYEGTVFEWQSDALGAQSAVCAGGRYDGLVSRLGGRDTPAVGFALGMERLLALSALAGDADSFHHPPHVYLVSEGERARARAVVLAERLREALPGLRLCLHCGRGTLKRQFRNADRSAAELALLLSDQQSALTVKFLRQSVPQCVLSVETLPDFLASHLGL